VFVSDDGTFRVLYIRAARELRDYRECIEWMDSVKSIIENAVWETKPAAVELGYTGRPAFEAEAATGMQREMTFSAGGTAVVIAVLFWLAHRRLKPMLWLLALLATVLAATWPLWTVLAQLTSSVTAAIC
jgi:predicted RND superfamily exporter protein